MYSIGGGNKMQHLNLKLSEAQNFVKRFHRHSKPLKRHMFSIGAYSKFLILSDNELVGFPIGLDGIVTVDRCSSAWSKERNFIELRRVCLAPKAKKNTASFLIGKAKVACFAMGYTKIVTYTQPHESGSSLLASGFWIGDYNVKRYADDRIEGLIRWECSSYEKLTRHGISVQKKYLAEIKSLYKSREEY
jgi:hypothetical protein